MGSALQNRRSPQIRSFFGVNLAWRLPQIRHEDWTLSARPWRGRHGTTAQGQHRPGGGRESGQAQRRGVRDRRHHGAGQSHRAPRGQPVRPSVPGFNAIRPLTRNARKCPDAPGNHINHRGRYKTMNPAAKGMAARAPSGRARHRVLEVGTLHGSPLAASASARCRMRCTPSTVRRCTPFAGFGAHVWVLLRNSA